MIKIHKVVALALGLILVFIGIPANVFGPQAMAREASTPRDLKPVAGHYEALNNIIDESVFPDNYPEFLKKVYILLRQAEYLKQLNPYDLEIVLKGQEKGLVKFFREMLGDNKLNVKRLYTFARAQVGENVFEKYLKRFGIDYDNQNDIELEALAQTERMHRREAYYGFVKKFNNTGHNLEKMIKLIKASTAPREFEYALRHCKEKEFEILRNIIMDKNGFGPSTSQDRDMLNYLERKRRIALDDGNKEAEMKWRAVISQLISQPVGKEHARLPFSKWELFAMIRNAERTVKQRERPFIDITGIEELDEESASYANKMIEKIGISLESIQRDQVVAYGFLDSTLGSDLDKLRKIYEDILSNKDSGQTEVTLDSVCKKKELIEILENSITKCIDKELKAPYLKISMLVQKILENRNEPYRLSFIRGIILFKGENGNLCYCFVEDYPMIVAGDTYPYQWKHDNEVNIALLIANVDPYAAAQAVRFIIYHGMWRGKEAKKVGLYGWLSQIIFANRQTGKMPVFNNRTYYYCPDFRLRPTKKIDAENERNRTSEIMQLPFFGWTVWRVYLEMKKANKEHALAFLKEVYPYVRANTEAIRTALDPFDEAVLSGRDAWVNGMDNAWYHLMVMNRHLPERFIPKWAMDMMENYRVDNRIDKKPGNPVDPKLAKGRPSDYYYAFKFVFYDIIKQLGLDPAAVYHATPYNAKDVAITGVMARSLEAQIAMAKVLKKTNADVHEMSSLRDRKNEIVDSWPGEINRYQTYLNRMKKQVNRYMWLPEDKMYYNRNVTQILPGIVEQQFCRIKIDRQNKIHFEPVKEYWNFKSAGKDGGCYVLNQKARDSLFFDDQICSISMDLNGNIHYEYKSKPHYWKWVAGNDNGGHFQLNVRQGDPFIVEQFCILKQDKLGNIRYEPNFKYWSKVMDNRNSRLFKLNEKAKNLMGKGARRIEDSELLCSPAIAGFFPLFGHIPSEEQAFQLLIQVVNPWMWWPVNGIPIPTQPMMLMNPDGRYIPNKVYYPDKYWRGPTWMASTKPVIDGFYSYGYEMMYLYLVQRTVGTLQDGRAVEHWRPETGEVNTSNINFPWAASCMAGSIWPELTKEEQAEYLKRFHPHRYAQAYAIIPIQVIRGSQPYSLRPKSADTRLYCRALMKSCDQDLTSYKKSDWDIPLVESDLLNKITDTVPNQWSATDADNRAVAETCR